MLIDKARLAHADLRHRRLQVASERLGIVIKGLTVATGLAAVAIVAALALSASGDRGLVIESFAVPPDLVQTGLTGEVAAGRLLDKLAAMQAATDSQRAPDSYANNWGADLKVEIPSTGVSIGELQRFLRDWLGHRTRISGDIVRTPAGLAITTRVGTQPGRMVVGPEADLDALNQRAAEAIFAGAQPYRYGIWLVQRGRQAEAVDHFRRMAALAATPADRAWAQVGLANTLASLNDTRAALAAARASLGELPGFAPGLGQLSNAETILGHDEAAYGVNRRWLVALRRGDAPITARASASQSAQLQALNAQAVGDFSKARAAQARLAALPDYNGASTYAPYIAPIYQAGQHELTGARASAEALPIHGAYDQASRDYALLMIADAAGDGPAALALADRNLADSLALGTAGSIFDLTTLIPVKALAMARSGDTAGALALIGTTPLDCSLCLRNRARIAAIAGDHAGADRWFAEAVRQTPSLPFALADWARALLDRGDLAGALAKARQANDLAPRFAEPLEIWAEALLRQGQFAPAEARLRAAAGLAPRWGRNQLMWGEALARLGKPDQAHARWLAARGMDLSLDDRARLERLLAGRR